MVFLCEILIPIVIIYLDFIKLEKMCNALTSITYAHDL